MAKESKTKKLKCFKCHNEKSPTRGFYISRSDMYQNDGRMLICKDCLFERLNEYMKKYDDVEKALYHICMNLDIYFSKSLYESSCYQENMVDSPENILATYLKNLNSLNQYKGMTSINSDPIYLGDEEIDVKDKKKKSSTVCDEIKMTPEIRRRWGREYDDDQCIRLEEYYQHYFHNYNHENDVGKLDILQEVCTYRLIKSQAIIAKDNKTIREFTELISKRMADAGLKPCQQRVTGEADEDIFGMQLYIYEKKKPVPKCLKEYLDVDKFWKYILKHMIKPLSVAMGVAQGEYSIDDGDKNIELSPKMQAALEESKNE